MSITCGYTCVDCKAMGPDVGDGGYLGAPMLESLPKVKGFGEPMPSFGYFFEALDGIGIRPYDLVALKEFLLAHKGHRLHISGADVDDDDDDGDDDDDDESEDTIGAHMDEQQEQKTRRTKSGEFRESIYELACTKCAENMTAEQPELLQHFEEFSPTAEALSMFVKHWGRDPDDGWNHRLMGIADPFEPFMEELVDFVKEHRRHAVVARLQGPK